MLLTNEFIKQYKEFQQYIITLGTLNRRFICEAADYYSNNIYVEFIDFAVIDDQIYIEFDLEYTDGTHLTTVKIPYNLLEPEVNDNLTNAQLDYIDHLAEMRKAARKQLEQEREQQNREARFKQYTLLKQEFENEFE